MFSDRLSQERISMPPDVQEEFTREQRQKRAQREQLPEKKMSKINRFFEYLMQRLDEEIEGPSELEQAQGELEGYKEAIHAAAQTYVVARIQHIRMCSLLSINDPTVLKHVQGAERYRSQMHNALMDRLYDAAQFVFQRVVRARRAKGVTPPTDRVDQEYADLLNKEEGRYIIGQHAIDYCYELITSSDESSER